MYMQGYVKKLHMLLSQKMFRQVLLLFLSIRLAAASATSELFTNPPNDGLDVSYANGSVIVITWKSDLEKVSLTLFNQHVNDWAYLRKSLYNLFVGVS